MATIIDTLITRFQLDDQFSAKAKQASQATQDLTGKIGGATQKMGGLTQGMMGLAGQVPGLNMVAGAVMGIGDAMLTAAGDMAVAEDLVDPLMAIAQVLLAIATAAVAAEAGLAAFAAKSFETYSKMDTMRRSFTGFLGSVKDSQQMMKFLEQYSVGKPFKLAELGDAAVQLSQLQLSVNKFLPMLTTLATVFKKPSESYGQSLQNLSEILMRLEGGETAMAMGPRGLGRMVSKKILEQLQPASFDAKGEYKGTTDQALDLLQKLADKEKKVGDAIKGGAEAMAADLDDAKEKVEDAFASGFAPLVGKVESAITASLTELAQSGVMKDFGETLAEIFDFDPSSGALTEGIIQVEAAFIQLSVTLTNVAKVVSGAFEMANAAMYPFTGMLQDIGRIAEDVVTLNWKALKEDISKIGPNGDARVNHKSDPNSIGDTFFGRVNADKFIEEAHQKLAASRKHPEKPVKAPEMAAAQATAVATQTDILRQIAFFTGQTAKSLERHAFGGGDLGRLGVTPAELSNRGKSAGATKKYSAGASNAVMSGIDAMLTEAIASAVAGMMRGGLIQTSRG